VIVARTRIGLAEALPRLRAGGRSVGLVPTMGYLHEGHLSLVEYAAARVDAVAVSIFVNPLQFGPAEDLAEYPRDEARDLTLLEDRGVAVAFVPSVEEMYPLGGPRVTIAPGSMAERLCGAFRPGHFRGVLTVVAKLFGLFRPDVAVFGRKDFQQAVLIRRMARDLDMGVQILMAPTVREGDGLAMSSRNAYLSPEERTQAVGLFKALSAALERFASGERSAAALREAALGVLAHYPLLRPQYLEIVDPDTLEPADPVAAGSVLAAALFCGRTRLIDNMEFGQT